MKFIQESLSMAARRELAAYFAKERNPAYLIKSYMWVKFKFLPWKVKSIAIINHMEWRMEGEK